MRCLVVVVLALISAGPAPAVELFHFFSRDQVKRLNKKLDGQVLDFTFNHGCDRRLYSNSLGEKRDIYIYVPPGYDGKARFPAILWLHGLGQDERSFLEIIEYFDRGIRDGTVPPAVIIAPDGSVRGTPAIFNTGSFYLNSKAGNFEDYIIQDVWGFLKTHYAIRPEREAHMIAGASMGGFGAFNLAFKHKAEFGLIAGAMPPLNLRYTDVHGNYFGDYYPGMATFRNEVPRNAIIGRFYGVILIRSRRLLDPLVGRRPADALGFVSRENPIEMLEAYNVQPGDYEMFIGYGTKDEFNIDAQAQHFVEVANRRGIRPEVHCVPGGHHNVSAGLAMVPQISQWILQRFAKFIPPGYKSSGRCGTLTPHCAIRQPIHFPSDPGYFGLSRDASPTKLP